MSEKKTTLEKLIKLNNTWVSRTYILHGIQKYDISMKKIKIILDCGNIIIVNNSRNGSSYRHLMGNKYRKVCKKCKLPQEKIDLFKTKKFSSNIESNKIDKDEAFKLSINMKNRINSFLRYYNEVDILKDIKVSKDMKIIERNLIDNRNTNLINIYKKSRINDLCDLERKISLFLIENGFLEVKTPLIISKIQIELMGIDTVNDPNYKLFKINDNKYLRPMLAPGLYTYLNKLDKIIEDQIKIFEIGKCFRRESDSNSHLEEFTMLNFCQMGNNSNEKELLSIIKKLFNYLNIEYEIINDNCKVYGKTIDIINNGLEIGSSVVGPVNIDINWGINKKWIGAGIGLERLIKIKKGYINIKRAEGSENYYNGIYLN